VFLRPKWKEHRYPRPVQGVLNQMRADTEHDRDPGSQPENGPHDRAEYGSREKRMCGWPDPKTKHACWIE
jgi:hypothetical protein